MNDKIKEIVKEIEAMKLKLAEEMLNMRVI